jgi:pimeloyl-ACP methyl ester carboxylesterase
VEALNWKVGVGALVLLSCVLGLCAGCEQPDRESGDKADAADTVAPEATQARASSPMRLADLDGAKVAYLDTGRGRQTVVLIHGWASDHGVWRRQIDALSTSHRVLAVDLPGHGKSTEPAGDYSMDLFASGIAAVMDDAGVDRAFLVAHSNGVPAVRQFYRKYPGRTAGLVLVDGALRKMFEDSMVEGFLSRFRGEEYRGHVAKIVDMMPPFELTDEQRTEIREMAVAQPQHAIVGGMHAAFDAAIWKEDPIDVPLLVVLAAQPAWTQEYESFVRQIAPQVDYRVLTGVSHFLMIERSGFFNEMLSEFLDQNRTSR